MSKRSRRVAAQQPVCAEQPKITWTGHRARRRLRGLILALSWPIRIETIEQPAQLIFGADVAIPVANAAVRIVDVAGQLAGHDLVRLARRAIEVKDELESRRSNPLAIPAPDPRRRSRSGASLARASSRSSTSSFLLLSATSSTNSSSLCTRTWRSKLTNHLRKLSHVTPLRDPSYGVVFEVAGPMTGLMGMGVAWAEVDVGAISPAAFHTRTEEVYFIIEGCGVMRLGDEPFPVVAGDVISIQTGVIHNIENSGLTPLRMVVATAPPYTDAGDHLAVDAT